MKIKLKDYYYIMTHCDGISDNEFLFEYSDYTLPRDANHKVYRQPLTVKRIVRDRIGDAYTTNELGDSFVIPENLVELVS